MKQDNGYKINSAIPTVFKANEEINWEETAGIVEFLRNINIDSISILLFGGEYYRLSLEEKKEQIELVTGMAASNQKVFVGLSDVSLDSTIKLGREAGRYGAAAGIISMPSSIPFYNIRRKLIKHFLSRVFDNSEISLIFQDTGMDENILPEIEFWRKYIENGKLVGFKIEGRRSLVKMKTLHAIYEDVDIYGGYLGINMGNEMKAGSTGGIIGSSVPDKIRETILNLRSGEIKEEVLKLLKFEVNHLYAFTSLEKYLLMKRGIISEYKCRCPCPPVSRMLLNRMDAFYNKIFEQLD